MLGWMARRLLLLVALLMGLTALAAGIAPRESSEPSRTSPVRPGPSARAAPAERGGVVARRLSTDGEPRRQSVVAELGDTVRLTVAGAVTDEVELRGLEELEGVDLVEAIDPTTPAMFELIADTPGDYAIALLDADRVIGTLHVKSDR